MDGAEVTLVEGEHIEALVSLGKHDDRCVGQSEVQVGVATHDGRRRSDICRAELGQLVRASCDLIEESQLRSLGSPGCEQVIQLGQHKRRENPRVRYKERLCGGPMIRLPIIERRENTAGVE